MTPVQLSNLDLHGVKNIRNALWRRLEAIGSGFGGAVHYQMIDCRKDKCSEPAGQAQ